MKEFYRETIENVFENLRTGKHGLSQPEAKNRLKDFGLNKLPEGKSDSYWLIFFRQFASPLIYILLGACVIVFFLGETLDAVVILAILLFNALVGMIQEGKAQNTLRALRNFSETKATVVRDGRELIVSDTEVVPGDIIILLEGEKVPADARVIVSSNMKVDESSLTGESEGVQKIPDIITNSNIPIADQRNMLFKGTNVLSGNGQAVVVTTGVETVIGKISKEILAEETEMPLKANIRHLSRLIIVVVACLSLLLFVIGIIFGNSAKEMFGTVISLSVSIIPEGLPIVMTLVLATGVWRMSKRKALVKKLQAVEALGQAKVIAVDKTGTITKNEMVVQKVYLPNGEIFEIEGEGYEPKGLVKAQGEIIDPINHKELIAIGKAAAFCSNARLLFSPEQNKWQMAGDPTEAAALVLSQKIGFHKEDLENESPLLAEIPFDYNLKYHATVHDEKTGRLLTVMGAPEEVISLCSNLSAEQKENLEKVFISASKQGLRIIGLAVKENYLGDLKVEKVKNLDFIGFLGMRDALRSEVARAMAEAKSAGIKVVMITGDHRVTAEAIARDAGIYNEGDLVLTGHEIDAMSDSDLSAKLSKTSVFARVTPEHKLRIIKAYRARGEVVAMTGDGVNDAPSLVAADLGVAMGKIGTEVAKEASDIILLDDNFGSIVGAVEEGRSIYKTIKKVILYLFSTSWGEVLTITGAILLGFPLPLLPAQIIWLNFVTDGFLDVSLAMEPKEKNLLKSRFDKPNKYIVDKLMVQRMFTMAIPMMLGTLVLFSLYFEQDINKAWTVSLTTLAVFQWFNAWNCRHESKSLFRMNPFSNIYLLGATIIVILLQALLVYNPVMQGLFKTVALTYTEWLMIIAVASSILWAEEIRKLFYGKR